MEQSNYYLHTENPYLITVRDALVPQDAPSVMHFHDSYELILVLRSQNQCFLKDVRCPFGDNSLIVVPPYMMHTIHYVPGTRYARVVINVKPSFLSKSLEALGARDTLRTLELLPERCLTLTTEQFSRLNALIQFLPRDRFADTESSEPIARARALLCLFLLEVAQLFERATESPHAQTKSDLLVRRIIAYLDERYKEDLSLDQIAKAVYVSKYYACHIFSQVTGVSIVSYLQQRRVLEAQKLLMTGAHSVDEVCFTCGFNNLPHFYRVFKRITGWTPGQYRPG